MKWLRNNNKEVRWVKFFCWVPEYFGSDPYWYWLESPKDWRLRKPKKKSWLTTYKNIETGEVVDYDTCGYD